MASYANDAEDTPVDRAKRTLAFASATSSEAQTPAGPPLSPYRDPSANCDPSEAPTPVRERRQSRRYQLQWGYFRGGGGAVRGVQRDLPAGGGDDG